MNCTPTNAITVEITAPYSSLPMAPHDTRPLAPPMMDRRHSPQEKDYAEQLRRNQLQNAPSIDRLPPPNQVSRKQQLNMVINVQQLSAIPCATTKLNTYVWLTMAVLLQNSYNLLIFSPCHDRPTMHLTGTSLPLCLRELP